MDISYLLLLQDFRNATHNMWTPLMENISFFGTTSLVLLPTFIYWCVNKRNGLFTLAAYTLSLTFMALIKLTACVYRPWIKDARIIPAGKAINTATGYSFPSGHTSGATPLYGGMAVGFWQKPKMRWLAVLCIVMILLTGFSRNYLGVHTPQDVAVGLLVGLLGLWISWKYISYIEIHPEKENMLLGLGILFAILGLLYITYKSYPMDYVNGKLLANPQRMMNDGYKCLGCLVGFCVGRYIEKTWVRFEVLGLTLKGILLSIVGMIPAVLMFIYIKKPLVACLGKHWGGFTMYVILITYIVALYPMVIKLFQKKK